MRSPFRKLGIILAIAVTSALAKPAVASERKVLKGHVPGVVASLKATGRLAADTRLNLVLGVSLRDPQGLSAFVQQVSDPASPQYRHYLTPQQFTERFGPTAADYQAVLDFAKASGFTVTGTHDDRMIVEVSAAASDVERAFDIALRTYPHPTEARTFFAPDTEPTVAAGLPMADINGLNDYIRPHPVNLHRRVLPKGTNGGPRANNASRDGSGPNGNFIGSDYRAAYAAGITNTGTGQSVGLLEFDNYYASDITAYESAANISNPPTVQAVLLGGYNGVQGDGEGEVALDVEMAMSIAPGVSSIICYEGGQSTSTVTLLSKMASATTVKQFSSSWSFGSIARSTVDTYFQKFASQGQSFFEASGDSGAIYGGLDVPQDDANITLVGGTALETVGPNGAWSGETAWNAPDIQQATGGGISTAVALPSWQNGVKTSTNQASTTHRNSPDVAMPADNLYIVADDGQDETSGGTSAAAPLWAGYIALVNQEAVALGKDTVGFINPALYGFYANTAYGAELDDVTFGYNTNGNSSQFFAGPGYDLCTGLGSPNGTSLMVGLAAPDGLIVAPGRGFVANGSSGGPFTVTSQALTLTNAGTSSLNWTLGNPPSWLDVSATSGSLSAHSAGTVTVSLDPSASSLTSGTYTADLWLTNQASGLAQLRQFSVLVDQNLVHDGGFESADLAYWLLTGVDAWYYTFSDNGYNTDYNPHSGLYFAALGASNDVAYLSQDVETTPGETYQLVFWLQNPSGITPTFFSATVMDATTTNVLYSQANLPAFNWRSFTYSVVAHSTKMTVQFGASDDNDYMGLDDVSIVPIAPPPSATGPTIQSIQVVGGSALITWTSSASAQYQVQSTTSLASPNWQNVGSPVTAQGSTASATVTLTSAPVVFYRVVLLAN